MAGVGHERVRVRVLRAPVRGIRADCHEGRVVRVRRRLGVLIVDG